jgi:antitoxin component of RelBE/YafQ-DinJ toxin-antitoxin module
MKIIITESQKRMILLENIGEDLGSIIKQNAERVKKLISEVQTQIGMNLQFLLTWGAGIGGFMGPVEDFVRGRFPELTDLQVFLIILGVISTHLIENKELNKKILDKIKEDGILKQFKISSKKTNELKSVFSDFVESLGVTFHRITNMLSYTFIIPIIPMIYQMVTDGLVTNSDLKNLATRVIAFTGLTISGILFKDLITKMVRRFKGK